MPVLRANQRFAAVAADDRLAHYLAFNKTPFY
jgi:GntR family transcriptional regulator